MLVTVPTAVAGFTVEEVGKAKGTEEMEFLPLR